MSRESAKPQAAATRNPSNLLAGLLRRGARKIGKAPAAAAPFKRKLLVETIEQRVLMDAEPLSVVTVGGSIDSAGEVDSYTFNLAGGARIAFDSLMSNSNLNWTLSGPSGKVIDSATFAAQSGNTASYRPLELSAGAYRIDVAGSGATTGAYKMNVLDLSRANAMALDTAVSGSVAEKGQTLAYGFDASAGDQLYLTWQKHPEVNLRIYDPFGQQVGSGDGWTGDAGIPQLAYTGRYTVLIDASAGVAVDAEFGFLLHKTVAPVQELGAWSGALLPLSAMLEGAGDRAVFTFTLDAARTVLLDSLTSTDQLRVSLTGPKGEVLDSDGNAITDRGLNNLDHGAYGLSRVQLAAGTYTLVLSGSNASKGAAALRLVDIGNAPVVSRGAIVSGDLGAGNTVHAVHFEALAGDTIDLDVLSMTSGASATFKLIDPYGRTVTYGWGLSDTNTIKLTANGRYTMLVSGDNARTAATQFSYRLVDRGNTPPTPLPVGTPLALGEVAEANIAANDTRVYNFTLDGTTKLYIDPLSQIDTDDSVKWSLTGPRGEEQSPVDFGGYATQSWDDGARLLTLPAGTYALTLKATSAQPALKLRVLAVDGASAAPVLPNTTVSGSLNPGAGMTTYSFNGTAGQRLFFNALSGSNSAYLNYRVLDPSGRTLIAVRDWTDAETTLKLNGTYTVLVEGANSIGATPMDYRFMVSLPQDGSAVLDPVAGSGTGPSWTSDGSQPAVRLDGRNEVKVEASPQLNLAKDVSFQVRLRVDSLAQDWQNIVYKGANINDANHRSYTMWVNSAGYLHLTTTEGGSQIDLNTANGAIKAGEWYDVAGVIDRSSGVMQIYINGELAASRAISTSATARVQDTPLYLGNSHEGGSPHRLDGTLGEFRLWDRALAAGEISTLRNSAPTVDASLKLWLKLNEAGGSTLADSSQYGLSAAIKSRFEGMGGVVAGNISLPGEQDVYRLVLDQTTSFYLDSLTPEFASNLRLAIDGPHVAIDETMASMSNRMITLVAGEYTFTINGNDRATGPYAFRLIDRASAETFGFGQTVSGNLPQPDTARLYSFEASAGDVLFFQNLGTSGGFTPAWRLIDPFGREVQGRANMDHREPGPLAYSGTYTVIVDGVYHHQGNKPAQFSFAVHKVNPAAPIAIDPFIGNDGGITRVPGRSGGGAVQVGDLQHIAMPDAGAWDSTGTFSLQASFRVDKWSANEWVPLLVKSSPDSTRQIGVYLNSAGRIHVGSHPNNSNSYYSVESANGLVKAGEWNNLAAVYDRAAGQLRILLNGQQVAQGTLSAAAAVDLTAPLRIGWSNETSDYRGALLTVDQVAVWNRVLTAAEVPASQAELNGNEAGLAALLRLNEESGAAVQDAKGGPAGSIVRMAQLVPGLIAGRIEQPGQTVRYTFTLNDAKQIYLDSLTRRTDLHWTLSGGSLATPLTSSLYHADSTGIRDLLTLEKGSYTLTIDGERAATGDFMLRLLDAAAATKITLDQNVSASLPTGAEARIYRFDGQAGQRIYLDHLSHSGNPPAWRLIDPQGKVVFGPASMGNRGPLELERSGAYTLIVEDYVNGGRDQARDYSFNLRTVVDRSIAIDLDDRLLWDPLWNAGASPSVPFNNHQQVVVAPSAQHDLSGNLTVEAMVKLDKTGPGWMPVVSRGDAYSSQSYGIWISSQGQVYFDSNDAGNFWNLGTGVNAIVPGDWHRISVSVNRTSGAAAMFIDGQQVATKTLGTTERDPATSLPQADLRIGGTALTDNRQQLTGSVADVRLWNVALSGAQIASQHGAALSGAEAGLVLNLKMTEGSGRQVKDSSANGLHGRIESINAKLPGNLIEGEIRKPGETVTYAFSAAQTGLYLFDGLSAASNFTWTLRDESGAVVSDRQGNLLSERNLRHNDHTNRIDFLLHGGRQYTLEIGATTDSTGRYAFRLPGFDSAQNIAYDTPVNATLDPANALAVYAFQGAAGDQVRLDYLSHSGDTPTWRLYDTNGVELHNSSFAEGNQALLTLSANGRYVLVFDGPIDGTGASRQRFQVQLVAKLAAPVAPGATALTFADGVAALSGTHAEANKPQLYSFTIDSPRRIYVDGISGSATHGAQWKLSGPFGQVAARTVNNTDGSDHRSFYDLPAGSYTFSAWAGAASALGAYAFRLVDLSVAPKALSFGVPTDGALSPANSAGFYKFSAQEGERLYFGNNSSTNTTNAWWRVLDAETLAVVAENSYSSALNNVVIPRGGDYLLAVEGYHSTTGNASFQFTAWRNSAPTAPMQLNERVAGNLAQPGDMLRYTFSLNADSRLLFDSLSGRTDVVWRVLDSEGVAVIGDRDMWDGPGEAASLLTLKKGSYTLVLDGSGAATGALAFRLHNLAEAIALTPGTAVIDAQLNPGNSSVAYRFDAVAGESFYFDLLSRTGGVNAQWRLLDPYGNPVFTDIGLVDRAATTVAHSGRYTLIVEGYPSDAAAVYSFNVVPVLPQTPVPLSIGVGPAPNLKVQDLSAVGVPAVPGGDTAIQSGGKVEVKWFSANTGSRPLTVPFQERVVVRNAAGETLVNQLVSYDPALLGAIAAEGRVARSAQITLPAGSRGAGALTISVITDVTNAVPEEGATGESDNLSQLAVQSQLATYPDLKVANVVMSPAAGMAPGEQVKLSWRVNNAGDKATSTPWSDRVVVRNVSTGQVVYDDYLVVQGPIAAGAGADRELVFNWPLGRHAAGQFEVIVTADAKTQIAENNKTNDAETNNSATLNFTSAPDLSIENLQVATASPVSGGQVTLTWNVRNGGNAATPAGWFDRIVAYNLDTEQTLLNLEVAYTPDAPIGPDGQARRSFTLRLPEGVGSVGRIRFSVTADQNAAGAGALPESNETNNKADVEKTATLSKSANLTVQEFQAPAAHRSGDAAPFSWTVKNTGSAATTATQWYDRIVLSKDAIIGNADDVTVASVLHEGPLAGGASYTVEVNPLIPAGYDGAYHFAVVTDVLGQAQEPDGESDNVSEVKPSLLTAYHADLIPVITSLPTNANGGQKVDVSWTVTNSGDAATNSNYWEDSVWLSLDGSIDPAKGAIHLGNVSHSGVLAKDASYTATHQVTIPNGIAGAYKLVVKANHYGAVFESRFTANNTVVSTGAINVTAAPAVNLTVQNVQGPATAQPGVRQTVSWEIANTGAGTASGWTDRVYLSRDGSLANAIFLASFNHTAPLAGGQKAAATAQFWMPDAGDGAWQIVVVADATNAVYESGATDAESANSGSRATSVINPDVRVADVAVGAGATAGRASSITWTTSNAGVAGVMPGWFEKIFISQDDQLDGNDILLGSFAVEQALGAAGSATASLARSAQVMLPQSLAAGSWRILVQSDSGNAVKETTAGEANNLAASAAVQVAPASLANLAAANVAGPASMRPGTTVSVSWDERNLNPEPVNGSWATQIFLSRDGALGGDELIATIPFTGTLAGNASAQRSAQVVLPATLAPGNWRFVVKLDSGNAVVEANEADNSAIAAADSKVVPSLQLNLNAASAAEGTTAAAITTATIVRNGDLAQPLTIALSTSDASEATSQATVTIPAGQSQVTFNISLPADGVVDGVQQVQIGVAADGFVGDSRSLSVLDSDQPSLAVTTVATAHENGGTVQVTVSRNAVLGDGGVAGGALLVRLTSGNTGALRVPGTVIIPAGQTSVTVDAQLMDDSAVWGTRAVHINAAAAGYRADSTTLDLIDDELPELSIVFSAAQVSENAGAGAVGVTVKRDRPGQYDLVLSVGSDNKALGAPTRVVIKAGDTEAHFSVTPKDDTEVNGSRQVFVRTTMLSAGGSFIEQNAATAAIVLTDNDGPTLAVTLDHEDVSEKGAPVTGTVRRNTGTSGDLTVNLTSSDSGEATVLGTVLIKDGQDSATFSITPVADNTPDGAQNVTIRASATGFNSGAAGLRVTEGDLPDLEVIEITQPASGYAGERVTISWTVKNNGLVDAAGGFRDRVYLSIDGELSAADRLMTSVIHSSPVAKDGSYTQTASIQLPTQTGKFRVVVVTDGLGSLAEGSERNNATFSSAELLVKPPITVSASTEVTQLAVSGEANATIVPISGVALDAVTGQPAANQAIKVVVKVGEVRRTLNALTDAEGKYTVEFKPLPGEAGVFHVGAGYAGEIDVPMQDSFTVLGMQASVAYVRAMGTNETELTGSFSLKNLGSVALSDLKASIEGLSGNFQFEVVNLAGSLAGSGTASVNWRLVGHGVTEALATNKGMLTLTTAEGVTEKVVLDLAMIPQTPKLVASKPFLHQGMLVGTQTLVSIDIMNQGAVATGPVKVELPDYPWMKLASEAVIANIPPGGKATVTLSLQPGADLALIRYDGAIALNSALGGISVPFQLRATSEAKGEMRVTVEDQLTYYAEGAPNVAGATVTLTDPYTFDVVATAVTGENGQVLLSGVPVGKYIMTINADKHTSYRATHTITAGTTTEETVFLDRQLVSYAWNVVPTEVEDKYKIALESTFETEVPLPVITAEPLKMPIMLPGVTSKFTIKITNSGLVQAENVAVSVPTNDPLFEIVALTPMIAVLPANSSVEVPVTIRVRDGVTPEQLKAKTVVNDMMPEGWGPALVQCFGIKTVYQLRCGPDGRWYGADTSVKPLLCLMDLQESALGQLSSFIADDASAAGAACDVLDLLLSCYTDNDCLSWLINTACGALVGGATGGVAGALAGAAGALDDLLSCLCDKFGPFSLPDIGGGEIKDPPGGWSGGSWGWLPSDGFPVSVPWDIVIKPAECKAAPVTALEMDRAEAGLEAAMASGAVGLDAAQIVAAHSASRAEQLAALAADGDGVLNQEEAGICAEVRIRIDQEAVLTRTAFQGTLEITNGNLNVPLTGVQLTLDIRDENGNSVNDLFATRDPVLNGLTGVDGTGVLAGGASGRAQYLFLPTTDAAKTQPTRYTIGGTLSYIEGGQKITVPLMPAKITVHPEAQLNLHYFQQRDVIGDDPFTKDVVEPSDPFALGLLVYNDGAGAAKNLTITSAQPKIIENEKGLLIDFKIIGTQVGTDAVAPTLTANLGNIAAGKTQVAQWMLSSTLQGKFTEFTASFEHVDGMGDERLSLIKSVNVHELIRSVKANGGDAPDFLANDDPDSQHTPDRLYMNDGSQHIVRPIANAVVKGSVSPGSLSVKITADQRDGWGYLKVADPGAGFVLDRIVRSDGKVLNLGREVWRTDRSFPESTPGAVRENLLHFIDENSSGDYTVFYKLDDAVAPRLTEIVAVSPDPATGPIAHIDIRFSEQINLSTLTVADLHLSREGETANQLANAQGVTITALGEGLYRIAGLQPYTAMSGLYRLTVNATGVSDYAGNAGTGVLTETWGVGNVGPYVLSMASGPAERNTALDTVDVTFSSALEVASFSAADLRLERDGVLQSLEGANLTLTPLAGNQYRIAGLAAVTAAGGNYTLTLTGSGLLSSNGAAGLGSQSVGWRMDTAAPTVLNIVDLVQAMRKIVVPSLEVELSEQVDLSTFDFRDVVLTRTVNGVTGANLIDARTKVEHVSGTTYRISGFNWVSGQPGVYSLTVDGAGIKDAAGNSGTGSASQTWTMDTSDPLAATNLAVSPDSGTSNNDGVLKSLAFTLTGTLAEPGLEVRVTDRTSGNEIGYATVNGTNFTIPVKLDAAGRHELRVRSVDAAGNISDATMVVFVDLVAPTLEEPVLTRDAEGNVSAITLNFSEPVEQGSVTLDLFTLSRDNGPNLLSGATLVRVSATQYVLEGLAALTAPAGGYKLAVDLTHVRDLAGNTGTSAKLHQFDGALASKGVVSGILFDDTDGSGTREADELLQGGWTVFDDADGDGVLDAGEKSAVSDVAGNYELKGVALGERRIVVVAPSGWAITPGKVAQVTLTAAAPTATRNFGAFALASISGTVFDDANANGLRDGSEVVLAGKQVLHDLNNNGVADEGEATAITGADGKYLLDKLKPGAGRLVIFAGEGYVPLLPFGVYAPKSGEAGLRGFALVKPGALSGIKYEDVNGNGQRDDGENGVAGWRIFLDTNGNDALDEGERSTLTDANGVYTFDKLAPGSYRVVEETRAGWIQTAPGTIEASHGQQTMDAQLSLPGMIADMEQEYIIKYLDSTGANFDCGCGTFVLEKYTSGQAAGHFTKLNTITDPALQGLTGKGVRVAVIDTGINTGSSFFGPDANGDGVADRIAYQYDFGDNDNDASDTMGHGTNVAGVIAGADAKYDGVATEADLVVLKVFDANNAGFLSTLRRSLEWLDENAEKYGIGVVNMSLGDGGNWGDAISRYGMGELFERLAAKGLVMVAASGNNYAATGGGLGVAYPGADPAVLSVGAMWAGNFGGPWRFSNGATDYTTAYGRIASFTQRDPDQIDVMAPGARFTSAGLNGSLSTMQGTSQAAAYMSGTAALVQQAAKQLMGRYLNTGEFAALLDVASYRAVDGDDESDNVVNSGASYNKLDIPKLLKGLKAYADTGVLPNGGVKPGGEVPGDSPLTAYSPLTATVLPGQTLSGQDFGNFKLGQVGGQVYTDANRDGVRQEEEEALAGVTMYIDKDDDGVLDENETRVVTDAQGSFNFGAAGPGLARIRAVAPQGQQVIGEAVREVTVTSGSQHAALSFGIGVAGGPVAVSDNATVNEDASVIVDVLANDTALGQAPVLALEGEGPANGTVELVDGKFVYKPKADFFGTDSFRYKVSGADGVSSIAKVTVTVVPVNDVPVIAPVETTSVAEGQQLVIKLAASDADKDTLGWTLVSGPQGATIDAESGELRWTAVAASAPQEFKVKVSDGKGGNAERTFSIDVQAAKLVVTAFASHAAGFTIRFNDVIDQSRFNLYGANPDLEVRGAQAGMVAGSVVFDADGKGFQFVRTGDAFGADAYTVRLKSGADGVSNAKRGQLDGDANGTAGGDYVKGFTVAAAPPVRLRLPDFARLAGQALKVPNTGAGMPVSITSDGTATSLQFKLMVDPRLIAVSEVRAGSGMPAGASLQVTAIEGGFLVDIQSATALPAGSRQLLDVVGSMAAAAPAGSVGVLRIDEVKVNGVAATQAGDSGVVFVGNVGDIDRNGVYDANDVSKLQRLVVKLDSFVAGLDDIDPTVIGDVDADGVLSTRDVALVQARTRAASTPAIPAIVVPSVAPAGALGVSSSGVTLNLGGSLGNFSLGAPAAPLSAVTVSGSSPVALKIVPSVVSEGVAS